MHALAMMIGRTVAFIYFGWQFVQQDTPETALIVTQYKTANAISVVLVLLCYAILGRSKQTLGMMKSLFCLICILLDSYFTLVTGVHIKDTYMYIAFILSCMAPNLAAVIIFSRLN
jgi:hypothetical protein